MSCILNKSIHFSYLWIIDLLKKLDKNHNYIFCMDMHIQLHTRFKKKTNILSRFHNDNSDLHTISNKICMTLILNNRTVLTNF